MKYSQNVATIPLNLLLVSNVLYMYCWCVSLQLHGRCGTVATREVPEVLHALRVCGKFLGYLDFLPYTTSVCTSLLQARTASVSHQYTKLLGNIISNSDYKLSFLSIKTFSYNHRCFFLYLRLREVPLFVTLNLSLCVAS